MGPVASPDHTLARYIDPMPGCAIHIRVSPIAADERIQIWSRKFHPCATVAHQPFDDRRGRVIEPTRNRQPAQMIKHDVHWEPIKQFLMRNDLIGGPMESRCGPGRR